MQSTTLTRALERCRCGQAPQRAFRSTMTNGSIAAHGPFTRFGSSSESKLDTKRKSDRRGYSTQATAELSETKETVQALPDALRDINWSAWQPSSRRSGLIALKRGMMTFIDDWGVAHACTILQVDQCQVIKVNSPHNTDHYGLEIGCTPAQSKHITHALRGHFDKQEVPYKRKVAEYMVSSDALLPPGLSSLCPSFLGTELNCSHFAPGQYVDIQGTSVGKGFQGVMKRWGFAGGPASHGTSLAHRTPGSVGQNSAPSRVFPGKKMPGQMGNRNSTVLNLLVLKIDPAQNLIYVKGAVPGHDDNYVLVRDAVQKWREHFLSDNSKISRPPFPTHTGPPTTEPVMRPNPAVDPLAVD